MAPAGNALRLYASLAVAAATLLLPCAGPAQKKLDPAAWGSSHVGKAIPEYMHEDECLFCHRNDIGPTWQKNSHGITVRQREDAPELAEMFKEEEAFSSVASQVQYFLGSRHRVRFLKKEGYGKFSLLNVQAVLHPSGRVSWVDAEKPLWDKDRFGERCAGCHATAVNSAARTFSAFGLDCYVCHGDVPPAHTKDTSLAWLSKKRRSEARAIASICAQCHLRGGQSRSSGLPYAHAFVAGDNLFQDFEVDFSRAEDDSLNPGDRHILRIVRDVAVHGEETTTCLNCHQIHARSTLPHRSVARGPICLDCHNASGPLRVVKRYTVHSALCEY